MGNAYEIYALRYATMSPRTPHLNFLIPDPHEITAQDLDYFVWLIRGAGRDILVDTGFNAEEAKARARKLTLNPVDALANFGVAAGTIRDVIVTHLHYDHAGNLDRFLPGHDPIVSEIYPRASDKVDAFALHLAPSRSFVK